MSAFQSATRGGGNLNQAGSPFYAEAQLGLARAYAMGSDKANAKKVYEDFFHMEGCRPRPVYVGRGPKGIRGTLGHQNPAILL